jgi:mobilization protein MobC
MARHKRSYAGERFTVKRTMKLTPSQAAELDAAAAAAGSTFASFARELLLVRSARAGMVAGARRNPEAAAIKQAMNAAAFQHNASGNNLNQIARHLNTTGDLRHWPDLRDAIDLQIRAAALHILALEKVLSL